MISFYKTFPFEKPGVMGWCHDVIGPGRWLTTHYDRIEPGDVWFAKVVHHNGKNHMEFTFKNDADATAFALRWE